MPSSETFEPASLAQWRAWLADHHDRGSGVWVVVAKPAAGQPELEYESLLREALCWGWIDGQQRPLDQQRTLLWFTRRRPDSPWGASNKARVAELATEGRLQPSGVAEIERAKANGMWSVLDSAEALLEPAELTAALDAVPAARAAWDAFPPSARKLALGAIALAKRPQTKARRIQIIVAAAERGERPF